MYRQIVEIEHAHVEARIERINNLLSDGILLKPSKKVYAEVTRRFDTNKAPFHRANNNSNADALIYLTAIEYLKKINGTSLVFITRDADDFGKPDNPEKELHPDFVIAGITTEYIFQIGKGIESLKQELGGLPDTFSLNKDFTPIFNLVPARDLPLLDRIYQALKKY
jgi:hypothetical protein